MGKMNRPGVNSGQVLVEVPFLFMKLKFFRCEGGVSFPDPDVKYYQIESTPNSKTFFSVKLSDSVTWIISIIIPSLGLVFWVTLNFAVIF